MKGLRMFHLIYQPEALLPRLMGESNHWLLQASPMGFTSRANRTGGLLHGQHWIDSEINDSV